VKGVPISRGVGDCKARGTAGECGEKAETGGWTPDFYPVVLFVYIRADGASWRSGYAEDCKSPRHSPDILHERAYIGRHADLKGWV